MTVVPQGNTAVEVVGVASHRCRGVAKLVKASDFDSDMRGFESFLPCHDFCFPELAASPVPTQH